MAIETQQLYGSAIKAIGAEQVGDALNVGAAHAYKLAADPMSLDAPVRNDVQRITTLLERLATRPKGMPALVLFRCYFKDVFAVLIDRDVPRPLTSDCIPAHVGRICAEYADVLNNLGPDFDADKVAQECAEVIAALEMLMRCALAAAQHDGGAE